MLLGLVLKEIAKVIGIGYIRQQKDASNGKQ